ncbi:MAG TPA: transcription antitermination factor NusB [Flavobacteriaceae bacterium]|nr:transcription antitermination factor NusB [Flavobacteriaceae bacterium]
MQVLYAQTANSKEDDSASQLQNSMEHMYKLYLLMTSLLIKLRERAIDHQKRSEKKYIKTQEDVNPNMRFVDNFLLQKLAEDTALKAELESHKIQYWEQDGEYVELIYQDLIKSDLYESFMSNSKSSLENDVAFVVEVFREIIVSNNKLYDYFQDKNITWVDDFPVVNTFIVKLFKRITTKLKTEFFTPNLFKDKEDEAFGFKLMKATRDNFEVYNAEIISKTKNWDKDRIAKIDFVLLQMAICEFQEFPSIPTKVTINEYIELAKEYSTPKSNVFINGVLDKIVKDYRNQKTLNKKGRGLM